MLIGIDIVVIDRVAKMMEKFKEKALKRFLDDDEIKLIKKPETAAGFWAAKEAASKAIGTGIGDGCSWYDMKISKNRLGQPSIVFSDHITDRFNITNITVSISHDGNFAIAVVAVTTDIKYSKS